MKDDKGGKGTLRDERLMPQHYFELSRFSHRDLFDGVRYVWEVLPRISDYLRATVKPGVQGRVMEGAIIEGQVFIGEGTVVEPYVYIVGPVYIGRNCVVRQGAYLRGDVLVGDEVVLGHACEFKNCLLMDGAQVPHFSYVGDSVLGFKSHLGAGVIVSNLKVTRDEITIKLEGKVYRTGLRKFGVILGDGAEIGCNAVLNPGTLVGRGSLAYPLTSLRGYYPPGSIIKLRQTIEIVGRR